MTTPRSSFDWTAWYAKIPGIPVDWGFRNLADSAAGSRLAPAASEAPYPPQMRLAR